MVPQSSRCYWLVISVRSIIIIILGISNVLKHAVMSHHCRLMLLIRCRPIRSLRIFYNLHDDYARYYSALFRAACGKSCLAQRFLEDRFSDVHVSTIGLEQKSRLVDLNDTKVKLQFLYVATHVLIKSI